MCYKVSLREIQFWRFLSLLSDIIPGKAGVLAAYAFLISHIGIAISYHLPWLSALPSPGILTRQPSVFGKQALLRTKCRVSSDKRVQLYISQKRRKWTVPHFDVGESLNILINYK